MDELRFKTSTNIWSGIERLHGEWREKGKSNGEVNGLAK